MNKYFVLISVLLYSMFCSIAVVGQGIVDGYQYTVFEIYSDTLQGNEVKHRTGSVVEDTTEYFSLYNAIGKGKISGYMDTTGGRSTGIMPPGLRVDLQVSDTLGNWAQLTGSDSIFSFTDGSAANGTWYFNTFTIPPFRYGRCIIVCDTMPWTLADTSKYYIRLMLGKQ